MKLLYIIIGLQNEGISNTLIQRLNYLSDKTSCELHVLSEGVNSESMVKKLNAKIQLHSLDFKDLISRKRLPFFGYFSLKSEIMNRYQQVIDELQPHIITVFDLEAHYKEIIPFVKTDAKKILELHGSFLGHRGALEYKRGKNKEIKKKKFHPLDVFKLSNNKLHNLYDYAIVLTKEDLQDRASYLKIPMFQVYNSVIPYENMTEFANRDNIIVAAGRLSPDKNFEDLILAASRIRKGLSSWQIHIYGDGPEKVSLEKLIHEEDLQHIVFLKGNSFNMAEVYNNAKILISTSLTEGFGRTLVEGLCFKIPIVSYDCKCGPKEIIRDGVNGYLVGFRVEDLANKMLNLVSDPQLLQSFSDHAWDDLGKFDFETNMQEWLYLYDKVGNNPE